MRPEDFSPGNDGRNRKWWTDSEEASMRPEDFSPGNMKA